MCLRVVLKSRRKNKQSIGDEAEEDRVCEEEPAEKEPTSSDTLETLHETDSEFVPSAAELQSKEISNSCTSESITFTGTKKSDAEALEEYSSEEVAASNSPHLVANQVQYDRDMLHEKMHLNNIILAS